MSIAEFEEMKFYIKGIEFDSGKEISNEYDKDSFTLVEGTQGESLIKLAVFEKLNKLDPHNFQNKQLEQVELSLKYQVICKQTALIGVMKVRDKATGELIEAQEINLSLYRAIAKERPRPPPKVRA